MKLYGVQAVVINSRQMRDADRVLTLYSREKGKIQAVAHGVSKPTSRKRGAVQPFCHSEFLLRRGRELDTVSQCEGRDIFPGLWSDLDRMGCAAQVCEPVDGLTVDREPNKAVFDLLLGTLRKLETVTEFELTVRGFELQLVALLGYRPQLDYCVNCGNGSLNPVAAFSAASGGLLCKSCAVGTDEVLCSGETAAIMRLLLDWDPVKMDRLRVSIRSRNEMRKVLREYLQWLTEKRSRSLHFLESISDYRTPD